MGRRNGLLACILDFGNYWTERVPMIEFAYNNNYHASLKMTPYEALNGRPCGSPVCWVNVGDAALLRPDLVRKTTQHVGFIRVRLRTTQSL
jgi:hypothetical protein